MSKILKIWGPGPARRSINTVRWMFAGLRDDGKQVAWSLIYDERERSFSCRAIRDEQSKKYAHAMASQRSLPGVVPELTPVVPGKGRIADHLSAMLPPEEKAKLIADSILKRSGGLL